MLCLVVDAVMSSTSDAAIESLIVDILYSDVQIVLSYYQLPVCYANALES